MAVGLEHQGHEVFFHHRAQHHPEDGGCYWKAVLLEQEREQAEDQDQRHAPDRVIDRERADDAKDQDRGHQDVARDLQNLGCQFDRQPTQPTRARPDVRRRGFAGSCDAN
jgi:hypothetical protein